MVDNNEDCERHFTLSDLRDLFRLEENTFSDTHSKFKCSRCVNQIQVNIQVEYFYNHINVFLFRLGYLRRIRIVRAIYRSGIIVGIKKV